MDVKNQKNIREIKDKYSLEKDSPFGRFIDFKICL